MRAIVLAMVFDVMIILSIGVTFGNAKPAWESQRLNAKVTSGSSSESGSVKCLCTPPPVPKTLTPKSQISQETDNYPKGYPSSLYSQSFTLPSSTNDFDHHHQSQDQNSVDPESMADEIEYEPEFDQNYLINKVLKEVTMKMENIDHDKLSFTITSAKDSKRKSQKMVSSDGQNISSHLTPSYSDDAGQGQDLITDSSSSFALSSASSMTKNKEKEPKEDPKVLKQVIFIEPPEYIYKHELNILQNVKKPKTLIYVFPPMVKHHFNITDGRLFPKEGGKPLIYFLKNDLQQSNQYQEIEKDTSEDETMKLEYLENPYEIEKEGIKMENDEFSISPMNSEPQPGYQVESDFSDNVQDIFAQGDKIQQNMNLSYLSVLAPPEINATDEYENYLEFESMPHEIIEQRGLGFDLRPDSEDGENQFKDEDINTNSHSGIKVNNMDSYGENDIYNYLTYGFHNQDNIATQISNTVETNKAPSTSTMERRNFNFPNPPSHSDTKPPIMRYEYFLNPTPYFNPLHLNSQSNHQITSTSTGLINPNSAPVPAEGSSGRRNIKREQSENSFEFIPAVLQNHYYEYTDSHGISTRRL